MWYPFRSGLCSFSFVFPDFSPTKTTECVTDTLPDSVIFTQLRPPCDWRSALPAVMASADGMSLRNSIAWKAWARPWKNKEKHVDIRTQKTQNPRVQLLYASCSTRIDLVIASSTHKIDAGELELNGGDRTCFSIPFASDGFFLSYKGGPVRRLMDHSVHVRICFDWAFAEEIDSFLWPYLFCPDVRPVCFQAARRRTSLNVQSENGAYVVEI